MRDKLGKTRRKGSPNERLLIEAWLDGQLEPEDRAQVEAWLAEDPFWSQQLPELLGSHRRLSAVLSRKLAWESLEEPAYEPLQDRVLGEAREATSSSERRRGAALDRLFARRSEANYLFAEAQSHYEQRRYLEAVQCVGQVFELRDPRSLLGTERLRELMKLAASCQTALGNSSAATDWWVRAKKLGRD